MNAAATQIIDQGIGPHTSPKIKPPTAKPCATTTRGACIHAYRPTTLCHLPRPDDQTTVSGADASGRTGITAAAGRAALELRPEMAGGSQQHHLTGATILGASSHRELKTLAIMADTISTTQGQPQDHAHPVWVVLDAAVDFQIIRRLARQPLHEATDSSLDTPAPHLRAALRNPLEHVVVHLVKLEHHRYSLGNGHINHIPHIGSKDEDGAVVKQRNRPMDEARRMQRSSCEDKAEVQQRNGDDDEAADRYSDHGEDKAVVMQ